MVNLTKILKGSNQILIICFIYFKFCAGCNITQDIDNFDKSWDAFLYSIKVADTTLIKDHCTKRGYLSLSESFESLDDYGSLYSLLNKQDDFSIKEESDGKVRVLIDDNNGGIGLIFYKQDNTFILDKYLPSK